jgi:hypothetical protein
LASADLSSRLVMDAQGDASASFVFRIAGGLNVKSGASIGLANEASAGNVFFVSNDSAQIGDGVDFKGNIFARNRIGVGSDTAVDGRVLSVKGDVALGSNAILGPQQTGVLEICKETVDTGLDLVGLTTANQLVRFNSDSANTTVTAPTSITGLAAGEVILGIDFRPATALGTTGTLYGLGSTSNLYTINQTTGAATLVGPLGVALAGADFGFDFNPTIDRIRVISNTGQNLSVDPNTGTATVQTPLNPGTPSVTAAAYTNSVAAATTTTLNVIDTANDTLNIQNPAASGTLTQVGPLGVNANGINGFDISPVTNTAVAALQVGASTTSGLYQINLANGAATLISNINSTTALRGLAIVPGNSTGLGADSLDNRIFRFSVAGIIAEVPVGQCSGPLTVPTGPQTITELQSGTTLQGGTFNGNFQLIDVRTIGQTPLSALTSANLPNFTANVIVREGGISNQIRIQFTNRFAITAIVEICKEGLDTAVTGFFNFTINELRAGNQTASGGIVTTPAGTLIPFTVPVGQCTGPIAVTVPSDSTGTIPRLGQITINEVPRNINGAVGPPAFLCTSVTTALGTSIPRNRLVSFNINGSGSGLGGCSATVIVVAGSDGGITETGGTAVQTTAFFNNRTAPGALKVCKIAGPGITVGQNFNFTVTGTNPLAPLTTATAVPVGGIAQPGATLQGGTISTVGVSVVAGRPENGGFCNDVSGAFVVDTLATVTELPAIANFGEVRVSRITSSSGIVMPVTRAPGAPFFPLTNNVNTGTEATRTVTVPINREVTEVEYVNIAFAPVPLKVCKVAGSESLLNQPFTFTVTPDTAGGLLAPFTSTVTVLAGPQAPAGTRQQNGFCDFVSGPFGGTFGGETALINGLTSFNFNSQVTITETGFGSTVINAGGITSPTGGVVANTTARTATITNLINGVNEVQFVNTTGTGPTRAKTKRARFF